VGDDLRKRAAGSDSMIGHVDCKTLEWAILHARCSNTTHKHALAQ